MRYEYKIKIDADMFGWNWNGEDPLDAEGVVVQLKRDFARVLNPYAKSHVFFNIQVKAVPHDNDRDYTEEDAEKHLNGEPEKKRKTYAEDFFEKFPNAGRNHCDGTPRACRDSLYGFFGTCDERRCSDCWNAPMPDESEDADA